MAGAKDRRIEVQRSTRKLKLVCGYVWAGKPDMIGCPRKGTLLESQDR